MRQLHKEPQLYPEPDEFGPHPILIFFRYISVLFSHLFLGLPGGFFCSGFFLLRCCIYLFFLPCYMLYNKGFKSWLRVGAIGNIISCSKKIYIHNNDIICNQFNYFGTVYFKENLGTFTHIHTNVSVRYIPNDDAQCPIVKLPYCCQR